MLKGLSLGLYVLVWFPRVMFGNEDWHILLDVGADAVIGCGGI